MDKLAIFVQIVSSLSQLRRRNARQRVTTLIEQLQERLQHRFPDAGLALDRPKDLEASWWLDAVLDGHDVTVEWRPALGFGVSAGREALFGESPDEVYGSLQETLSRVEQLVLARESTTAPGSWENGP